MIHTSTQFRRLAIVAGAVLLAAGACEEDRPLDERAREVERGVEEAADEIRRAGEGISDEVGGAGEDPDG